MLRIRKPSTDVYVGDGTQFIGNIHESEGIATGDNRMNSMIWEAARRCPEHSHRLGVACSKAGRAPAVKPALAEELLLGPEAAAAHIMAIEVPSKVKEAGGKREGDVWIAANNDTLLRIAQSTGIDARLLLELTEQAFAEGLRGVNNRFKPGCLPLSAWRPYPHRRCRGNVWAGGSVGKRTD